MYLPPKTDFNVFIDRLYQLLNFRTKENKYIIFGGDFNINYMESSTYITAILELQRSYMYITIDVPIRAFNGASRSLFTVFIADNIYDLHLH